MRPAVLLVLAAAVLGGCSLFGPEVETLDTTTLLQTNTLVTSDADTTGFAPFSPFISNAEQEATFRTRYGIAEPFGVDYTTATVVVGITETSSTTGRIDITAVELIGDDRAKVTYVGTGITRTPSSTTRYPLHVVRVRRIADIDDRSVETEGSTSGS